VTRQDEAPAALCRRRPDPQRVSLRVRPGAYAGPVPLNPQARVFLAGWTNERGLYFDGASRGVTMTR
jgi:hypothetical protein